MKKLFLILLLFFFSFNVALAAGLAVTPDNLYIETKVDKIAETSLMVKNISTKAALYSIYTDELADQIEIIPNLFQLMSNESMNVIIQAKPNNSGIQATVISVIAQDLNRKEFNAGTGVKVDLVIKALAQDNVVRSIIKLWLLIIITILVIIIVYLITRYRQRQSFWYKVKHPVELMHKKPWYKKIFK